MSYQEYTEKAELKTDGAPPEYTITAQPTSIAATVPVGPPREWNSSLFACTDDCAVCMCVWCCTPFYQCYKMDEFGEHCCNAWPCCLGSFFSFMLLRYRMRALYNIEGTMMKDCVATVCCYGCMACQLLREKKYIDSNEVAITATKVQQSK